MTKITKYNEFLTIIKGKTQTIKIITDPTYKTNLSWYGQNYNSSYSLTNEKKINETRKKFKNKVKTWNYV